MFQRTLSSTPTNALATRTYARAAAASTSSLDSSLCAARLRSCRMLWSRRACSSLRLLFDSRKRCLSTVESRSTSSEFPSTRSTARSIRSSTGPHASGNAAPGETFTTRPTSRSAPQAGLTSARRANSNRPSANRGVDQTPFGGERRLDVRLELLRFLLELDLLGFRRNTRLDSANAIRTATPPTTIGTVWLPSWSTYYRLISQTLCSYSKIVPPTTNSSNRRPLFAGAPTDISDLPER
jgi:hypothetical protein